MKILVLVGSTGKTGTILEILSGGVAKLSEKLKNND